jgi:glutathione S-transferase
VRTPAEKRDTTAIEAGINACDELFALLDDALATQPWLSGDEFGPGDIAVAPFVYNLYNIGLSWAPRPYLERWYQRLTERPAFREVVMIPVT